MIDELLKLVPFQEEGVKTGASSTIGNVNLTYTADDKLINITLTRVEPEFFAWLDGIDDEVFEAAIDAFQDRYDGTMAEFTEAVKNGTADEEIELFKDCVRQYVNERIEKLNSYVR